MQLEVILRSRAIRSISNKINNTTKQTSQKNSHIHPLFITGLFDAHSSFVVTVIKNSRYSRGWNLQARVQIKMYEKDRALIVSSQEFFGEVMCLNLIRLQL